MSSFLLLLETTSDGRWHPGIGDPSWTGWLTVGAYALAATLAWLAFRSCWSEAARHQRTHPHEAANERRLAAFWLVACLTVSVLGINKQLDLQSLLTQTLRETAHLHGWYEERRRYQAVFVVAIAGAGVLGVGTMGWVLRRVLARVWMGVLGLGWITSFVVIRAASFHHVDTFLRSISHAGNVAFELSGIAMVAAGARRVIHSRTENRVRVAPAAPSASDGRP